MKYIKLLWFDVRQGLLQKPLLFIVPVLLALIACIELTVKARIFSDSGFSVEACFADFIMFIYGGRDKYLLSDNMMFTFPVRWLIVMISVSFITLNYPFDNLQAHGQQILLRSKSRIMWWLAKCGWNIVTVLVYHGVIILTVAIFCIVRQANFTGGINKDLIYGAFGVLPHHVASGEALWPIAILILPIFISVGMNLVQMILSLFIKPMFSFFGTGLLLISSTYFASPYFIGNYAMSLRYNVALADGVSIHVGIIVSVLLVAVPVVFGCIRFHKYDILNLDR